MRKIEQEKKRQENHDVAHFTLLIQSTERSQIFVMAVKIIKFIHIRISKIHKMSCIWNIQNTY